MATRHGVVAPNLSKGGPPPPRAREALSVAASADPRHAGVPASDA
ncbi:hypothetical protein WME95_12785 [Sorangium sp. So ce327]